jgi:hypothetical protein
METAARQGNLPTLEYLLQDKLRSQVCPELPIQVSCAMKRHILMVLVEHSARVRLDWKQVFRTLEQSLKALELEFTDHARLYLRLAGQQKPYAFHTFKLAPVVQTGTASGASTEAPRQVVPLGGGQRSTAVMAPPSTPTNINQISSRSLVLSEERTNASTDAAEAMPEPEAGRARINSRKVRSSRNSPIALVGAGTALLVLLGSLYAVTRPCVLGECTAIQEADNLRQASLGTMLTAQSGQDLTQAQKQLKRATRLLSAIPPWSDNYREAQAVLPSYQAQVDNLDRIKLAEETAYSAAVRSQNPPHSVLRWQEIESLWQSAIAQLAAIPADSVLFPLAQNKRSDYQVNLNIIQQRLANEQNAQGQLANARAAARLAETRQGIAQSPESWQLVHATWQTVINRLRQIPPYTTAHREANELLAVYQPKSTRAENRKFQESLSAKTYNQAIVAAQKAQTAEQQNLWFQATANWRDAVTYINQVPNGTFFYNQSQPLVNAYSQALKQAEEKLQVAVVQQRTHKDLQRVCAGPPTICSYSITNTHIKIKLTPTYEQTIAAMNYNASDRVSYVSTMNHAYVLRSALQTISNNAGRPLEIYSTDDVLIDVFNPQ